ncbi:MAG: hypothetical protein ACI80V_000060 [Rhodothermales bacterium]
MAIVLFFVLQTVAVPDSLLNSPETITPDAMEDLALITDRRWATLAERDWGASASGWTRKARYVAAGSFWKGTVSTGRLTTGFVELRPSTAVQVLLGDFRTSAGAGLVSGSTRFGTPESAGAAMALRAPSSRGYAGTSSSHLRGSALALKLNRVKAGIWAGRSAGDGGSAAGARLEATTLRLRAGVFLQHLSGSIRQDAAEFYAAANSAAARVWAATSVCRCGGAGRRLSSTVGLSFQEKRGSPSLRISGRTHGLLPSGAAPASVWAAPDARESGWTVALSFPFNEGKLEAASDHAWSGNGRSVRSRVSYSRTGSSLQFERRSRSDEFDLSVPPYILRVSMPEPQWRLKLRLSPGASGPWKLNGLLAHKPLSWARMLQAAGFFQIRAARIDLSLTEFDVGTGAPVVAVYEPGAGHAFPIARLTGSGRRYHVKLAFPLAGMVLEAALAYEFRRPQSGLDTASRKVSFALALLSL